MHSAIKQVLWVVWVMTMFSPVAMHAAAFANVPPQSKHYGGKADNVGVASWYGQAHQGKIMANGKPFDRRALTAASRTLPLGLWIRVFDLDNGKSVDVQVTDRGPNARLRNRILDLSEAAATRLGFRRKGLAVVKFVPLPAGREQS